MPFEVSLPPSHSVSSCCSIEWGKPHRARDGRLAAEWGAPSCCCSARLWDTRQHQLRSESAPPAAAARAERLPGRQSVIQHSSSCIPQLASGAAGTVPCVSCEWVQILVVAQCIHTWIMFSGVLVTHHDRVIFTSYEFAITIIVRFLKHMKCTITLDELE